MNDITDFISKAIKKNYRIDIDIDTSSKTICVFNKNNDSISFSIEYKYNKDLSLNPIGILISNGSGKIQLDSTPKDITEFNLLYEEVKEYSEKTLINKFNNFFKEDEITINDLDSEDD